MGAQSGPWSRLYLQLSLWWQKSRFSSGLGYIANLPFALSSEGEPLPTHQDPGRLLLLRVRPHAAQDRPCPLLRGDGPGHDRHHHVSALWGARPAVRPALSWPVSEVGHLCRGCREPVPPGEVQGEGVLPALRGSASRGPFCAFCWGCAFLFVVIPGIVSCVLLLLLSLSHVQLLVTPRTAAYQVSLSFTISLSLLKLTSFESMMLSNHLILGHPHLLLAIFSSIWVFSNELALPIRWPKYWSFNFSISPSSEYSGLISFRMDRFDLAVQGTLKSLLQNHSSKASVLWHSAFFMVQLSHLYMTTGKAVALTIWPFVGKMMSLLFNMLSWFVIIFLPRNCALVQSKERTFLA